MSAWWGKKANCSRKKEEEQQQPSIKDWKRKEKPKSFNEISTRNLAKNRATRTGSDFVFDSETVLEKKGHPLPRPSVLSALSLAHDHGVDSGSVSSTSSTGSSDDPQDYESNGLYRCSDSMNMARGRSTWRQQHNAENRHLASSDLLPDISASPIGEHQLPAPATSPCRNALCSPRASTEIKFNPRSRSPTPSPVSRGQTIPISPFNPRACGSCIESSVEKQDDRRNQGHPLPLPPSTTNSSTLHTLRNNGVNDSVQFLHSRWKKGKLLGRGTFGHVYAGFNSENGQMCAIKEVRVISDDQKSKECLRQLNQEITLLSQLSHPNIVQYYGSELTDGTLSVYLEYVSGGSIHKLLQEYGPFKEPVIQSYTGQILAGLAYLHGRNTVHRDIKGANILVDPNGEIKLVDFGLAKHITTCSSVLSFKGSPYWMAPEVIMNCNGYNLAVDIWSLGCTVLEMATSKPPWSQYEGVAAIFKIGNSKDIPQIPDHISDDGKDFLKLCLQRDPSARPTAAKLLEHPFIRNQATVKIAKTNIIRDTMQSNTDNSHMPNKIVVHSNQRITSSCELDYGIRHMGGLSTACNSSSDQLSTRANLSLPVSPCSNPLRPTHTSCFLSPPHPTYSMVMGGYGLTNPAFFPAQPNANLAMKPTTNHPDLWPEIS